MVNAYTIYISNRFSCIFLSNSMSWVMQRQELWRLLEIFWLCDRQGQGGCYSGLESQDGPTTSQQQSHGLSYLILGLINWQLRSLNLWEILLLKPYKSFWTSGNCLLHNNKFSTLSSPSSHSYGEFSSQCSSVQACVYEEFRLQKLVIYEILCRSTYEERLCVSVRGEVGPKGQGRCILWDATLISERDP